MAKTKIYCPDIECDSCIRLISRKLSKLEGVTSYDVKKDSVDIKYNEKLIKPSDIATAIKENGYRADFEPFARKTFRERLRDFTENKSKYQVEYKMIKYSLMVFLSLLILHGLSYYFFWQQNGFLSHFGWWFFYLDLTIVSIGAAMWHLKSYRAEITPMVGMMIGMTFGMQSGLMLGTIFGASMGTFAGAMIGMLSATFVGWYNGKCCGIMGILEGMMAGMMNGLMGMMIGVMLFPDRILWFMPFFMTINMIIMWGLSYMLYEEVVEVNPKVQKSPLNFFSFLFVAMLVTSILTFIMVYGLKSGLARFT